MKDKLLVLNLLAVMAWCCQATTKGDNAGERSRIQCHVSPSVDTITQRTIQLIDTTLEEVGRVQVYYYNGNLVIETQQGKGTLPVSDSTFFSETKSEYSNDIIEIYDNRQWSSRSIIYSNGILMFVIRNRNHIPHFYTARLNDNGWKYLCISSQSACSFFSRTPNCIVFHAAKQQILQKPNGVGYDVDKDIDYQDVIVYRCGDEEMEIRGRYKFESLQNLECEAKDIKRWFIPYLKFADADTIDCYINLNPESQ